MSKRMQVDCWRLLVAGCLTLMFCMPAQCDSLQFDGEIRQWTDSTGNFQVNAKLTGYVNRKLMLQAEDGRQITISIDRISRGDQSYTVDRLRAARRIGAKAESKPRGAETLVRSTDKVTIENQAQTAEKIQQLGDPERKYGISWWPEQESLRLAKMTDKPVYWFRVLGDLSGFM